LQDNHDLHSLENGFIVRKRCLYLSQNLPQEEVMLLKKMSLLLTLSLLLIFTGCLKAKKTVFHYAIGKDMRVVLTVSSLGVEDDSKDIEVKKKKMQELYAMSEEELNKEWGLGDGGPFFKNMTIENKQETECDIISIFEFPHIMATFLLQSFDGNFTFRKEDSVFYFFVDGKALFNIDDDTDDDVGFAGEIRISYEGEIIKHNAHEFDKEFNTMIWNIKDIKPEGIYFELLIPKDESSVEKTEPSDDGSVQE